MFAKTLVEHPKSKSPNINCPQIQKSRKITGFKKSWGVWRTPHGMLQVVGAYVAFQKNVLGIRRIFVTKRSVDIRQACCSFFALPRGSSTV